MGTRYEVLNEQGEVINRILASAEFMEANFQHYREERADPPSLEDLKSAKIIDLAAEYQSRVQSFPWDFGAPFGVLHLQLRGTDDQANWLTLQAKAMNHISAGQGDAEVLAIRTEENITVPVTANVAAQVMDALSSFGGNMKAHQWALKDAINAAEDEAALEAIDITAGWPA